MIYVKKFGPLCQECLLSDRAITGRYCLPCSDVVRERKKKVRDQRYSEACRIALRRYRQACKDSDVRM